MKYRQGKCIEMIAEKTQPLFKLQILNIMFKNRRVMMCVYVMVRSTV